MAGRVLVGIPCLFLGGTEMQTRTLAQVLVDAGHQVTVLCYYEEVDERMVTAMEAVGAEVLRMGLTRSDGKGAVGSGVILVRRLIRTFRQLRPDVVHVQYMAPGFLPVFAAWLARVPVLFATVHQPGRVYGWKAHVLLRTAARLCNVFFCVSQAAERSWFGTVNGNPPNPKSQIPNRKSQIVNRKSNHFTLYNAVDVPFIQSTVQGTDIVSLRQHWEIGQGPVVGVVARLRREKGHALLFEAMTQVLRRIPEVMLLVVGDGPDREELVRLAEALGIAPHIRWTGQVDPEAVYRLYALMDVVAVPSQYEGFGLTAVEGMAAGKPVVATNVDGLTEVVEDGVTGLLVPEGDPVRFAQALMDLLTDSEKRRRMGQAGQRRVQQYFSMEQFAACVRAVYGRAMCKDLSHRWHR